MSAEDHARAADIPNVKGTSPQRGRALKPGELSALFAACDATTTQGARDAALLAVLYGAGLRRAEAVALDLCDYNAEDGALIVQAGKGRKARTVYVTNGAKEALLAWLDVRGTGPGTIIQAVDKAGNVRPGASHQAPCMPSAAGSRGTPASSPSLPTTPAAVTSPRSSRPEIQSPWCRSSQAMPA
jgi:integrase